MREPGPSGGDRWGSSFPYVGVWTVIFVIGMMGCDWVLAGGGDAVTGGLVGVPRSAPGIPRSHSFARSRPFRGTKGAGVLVWLVVSAVHGMGWRDWLFGWCAPLRPGHTPLA